MNLTVLSLLFAVAQPVIQTVFTNYSDKKIREAAKMAMFTCLHSIKGRRRYKSILLKDKSFSDSLTEKLKGLGLFDKITVNNVTGTILLTYKGDESDIDTVINHLNQQTQKVTDRKSKLANSTMSAATAYNLGHQAAVANLGQQTLVAKSIRSYTSKMNSKVKSSTRGFADLSNIIGLVCVLWGGYKILSQNQVPSGPSLVWWGYKILEGGTK